MNGPIPSLDGLRAVAFAIVLLSHAPGFSALFPGGFGVTIFFFLSGFLITTLMRVEFERTGTLHLGNFFVRRALRIFPPMYLTLVVTAAVGACGLARAPTAEGLTYQALHLTNFYVAAGGLDHLVQGTEVYWSLAVEEHYYLLFPLLALGLLRSRSRHLQLGVLAALCLAVLAWRTWLFHQHVPLLRLTYGTDTRIDSILFGAILALGFNPVLDRPRWTSDRLAALALGVSTLGLLLTILSRDPMFRETVRYTLQGLLLMPVYHVLITRPTWPVVRWLNTRWIQFVGVLSYALYLIHNTVLHVVRSTWPELGPVGILALTLALSLAYAYGMHHLVERPLLAMRKRLRHPEPEGATPGA